MDVVAESVSALYEERQHVHGLRFTLEPEYLRFFQARFEPVSSPNLVGAGRSEREDETAQFART
jgi:hypothetical protein